MWNDKKKEAFLGKIICLKKNYFSYGYTDCINFLFQKNPTDPKYFNN